MPQTQHPIDLGTAAAISGILGAFLALARIIPPLHRWLHRRALARHIALTKEGFAEELKRGEITAAAMYEILGRIEALEADVRESREQLPRIEGKVDSLGETVDRISTSLNRLTLEQLPDLILKLGQVQGAQGRL